MYDRSGVLFSKGLSSYGYSTPPFWLSFRFVSFRLAHVGFIRGGYLLYFLFATCVSSLLLDIVLALGSLFALFHLILIFSPTNHTPL